MTEAARRATNVVVLITGESEYRIMRRYFEHVQEEMHPTGTIYERGSFLSVSGRATAALFMESGNNVHTASETERALNYYTPEIVLCVGEAEGITGVRPGDVVVASKVYHYEPARAGLIPLTMPEVGNPSYRARQRATVEARKSDWLRHVSGDCAHPDPRVILAPVAAGAKILTSTQSTVYELLRTHFHDAVAVDTQGYGFLLAVQDNQSREHQSPLESLVIRAITKMVSEPSTREEQTMAAERACAFAFHVLTALQLTTRNQNLERGVTMLMARDYQSARRELRQAISSIHKDSLEEAAQARYLLALAILGTDVPRVRSEETIQAVEQLLSTAFQLHPSSFYLWSLALIQEDYFLSNGLRSRSGEVAHLEYRAAHTSWNNEIDAPNVKYFQQCQPELFRRFTSKIGKSL
jgi:hypothetical protein